MTELTAHIVDRRKARLDRRNMERQKTRTAIQSAREKLTSTTGLDRTFESDTLDIYAKAKTSACLILAVYTAVVAGALLVWANPIVIVMWTACSICALSLSALSAKRFAAKQDEVAFEKLQARLVAFEALQSVMWSSLGVAAFMSGETHTIFIVMALLVYASAASIIASSVKRCIYAALAPVILTIAILALTAANSSVMLLCGLAMGAIIFFMTLALRTHDMSLMTLGYRAEKDLLIGALEEANAKHDEARRRAEEANLAKSRFLATMSHELRTPLNAILGFSEVMKNELFGPHPVDQYLEYSKDIHSSGQHLLNIINEILDLSRIEAGRYDLQEEAVDLGATADDCRHMLEMRAKSKQITLSAQIERELPRLWADERAIRQIIINLLANGIKFTPEGGEVTVKVGWTAAGGQYIAIKDTGPGIPEDEIPIVLETFGRGSTAIKTAEQGTGLGLPIVKGLVDLHGGQFHLRSKLREGTEVLAIFPPARVMQAMAPMAPGSRAGAASAPRGASIHAA
jgi:two-component system, cell cycle sensor histidine kinase PleC